MSVLDVIAQQFLYMLPARAGETLLLRFKREHQQPDAIKWLQDTLNADADTLIERTTKEGDEGDKLVCLDVFLWKQRHKLISPQLRISPQGISEPFLRYIYRYMVENGYDNVLDPTFGERPIVSIAEICRLLDQFADGKFDNGDQYWSLTHLLNILGPKVGKFHRRPEVLHYARYLASHFGSDPALNELADDVDLSGYALLMLDLGLEPQFTWQTYTELLLKCKTRSVMCYPALLAGLQMYPQTIAGAIDELELQGGTDLFWSLVRG